MVIATGRPTPTLDQLATIVATEAIHILTHITMVEEPFITEEAVVSAAFAASSSASFAAETKTTSKMATKMDKLLRQSSLKATMLHQDNIHHKTRDTEGVMAGKLNQVPFHQVNTHLQRKDMVELSQVNIHQLLDIKTEMAAIDSIFFKNI